MMNDSDREPEVSDSWRSGYYYNAKTGKYHRDRPGWWGEKYILHRGSGHSGHSGHSGYGGYKYTPPPKPWEGVDRNRFPATWNVLVMFYYSGDWHSMTTTTYPKYAPDAPGDNEGYYDV